MKESAVMLSKAFISLDFSHSHCGYVHCGRMVSYLSQQMKRLDEEAATNTAVARKQQLSWMLLLYILLHISNFLQLQLFCL